MLEKLMPRSDAFFDDFARRPSQPVARRGACCSRSFEDFTISSEGRRHQGSRARRDNIAHARSSGLHRQSSPVRSAEIHRLIGRIDDCSISPTRRRKSCSSTRWAWSRGGEGPWGVSSCRRRKSCAMLSGRCAKSRTRRRSSPSCRQIKTYEKRRRRVGRRPSPRCSRARRHTLDHEVEGDLRLDGDGHRPLRDVAT